MSAGLLHVTTGVALRILIVTLFEAVL